MSQFFTFIATKTTYSRAIPFANVGQAEFNRKIALAFQDISDGTLTAGELKQFPKSTAIANHLLCDGSEVDQAAFPELYQYLGDSEGVAAPGKFKLPNYIGAFSPATVAPPQIVEGGTVTTGGDVVTPEGEGQTGGTTGGAVPSGGRYTRERLNLA